MNGSEFKLHFKAFCDTYGIKLKPTNVKNTEANAILECMHQVIMAMLCTAQIDMANLVTVSDIDTFLTNVAWTRFLAYVKLMEMINGDGAM